MHYFENLTPLLYLVMSILELVCKIMDVIMIWALCSKSTLAVVVIELIVSVSLIISSLVFSSFYFFLFSEGQWWWPGVGWCVNGSKKGRNLYLRHCKKRGEGLSIHSCQSQIMAWSNQPQKCYNRIVGWLLFWTVNLILTRIYAEK